MSARLSPVEVARRQRLRRSALAREQFRVLITLGLPVEEVVAWAPLLPGVAPVHVARMAKAWRHHGVMPTVAAAWNRYGLISPAQAQRWAAAGYTPEEANFVMANTDDRTANGARSGDSETLAEDWLRSGIPPTLACRFLAANVTKVPEAVHFWETMETSELEAALGTLTALITAHAETAAPR